MSNITVSEGSVQAPGDMIAINPTDPEDQWLVPKAFFEGNYLEG